MAEAYFCIYYNPKLNVVGLKVRSWEFVLLQKPVYIASNHSIKQIWLEDMQPFKPNEWVYLGLL